MTKEALRMALEALDAMANEGWLLCGPEGLDNAQTKCVEAITAIKEALAKEKTLQALHSENERLGLYKEVYAEQEPVAWTLLLVGEHHGIIGKAGETFATSPEHYRRVDVYTTPPQRKPLTDEQIDEEFKLYASKFDTSSDKWLDMGADDYFKAGFKAAHGIKENKHDKR